MLFEHMENSCNNYFNVLSTNSVICVIPGLVLLIFLLIRGHIFLLLYMPGNFLLDSRHCEFYLGCWIFLYFYKYS